MVIRTTYNSHQKKIYRWLLLGCFLIGSILIIGGITRLTQSGLSMVKWEPIMGTVPPLTAQEWQESFELYQQSPEFRHYNSDFTLSDYKKIFFWEYIHRLLGRIIGLLFLFPALYFWMKGYLNRKLKRSLFFIFLLGTFQGFLGWFMVKSGLKDVPHVSHFRLAAHLVTALALMVYIYWVALTIKYERTPLKHPLRKLVVLFIAILSLQIIYGAFVAGLKAGLMYNTFPLMGDSFWPRELNLIFKREGVGAFINSGNWVQLIHRLTAILLVIVYLGIYFSSRRMKTTAWLRLSIRQVGVILLLQFTLGVLTVLYAVPISMGVVHQLTAVVLVLSTIHLLFVLNSNTHDHHI